MCRCIGWYHSHPHFAAHPSIIDIKNQVNQQHQYRLHIYSTRTMTLYNVIALPPFLLPYFASLPSTLMPLLRTNTIVWMYRMGTEELYIATIISPYDEQAHGDVSALTWFHVAHEIGRIPGPDQDPLQAGCRPMALQVIACPLRPVLMPMDSART